MRIRHSVSLCGGAVVLLAIVLGCDMARADESQPQIPPKLLIDFTSPDAARQLVPGKGQSKLNVITVDAAGISATFPPPQPGDAKHPCVHIVPAQGQFWDLSAYGHVEATITNTSDKVRFDIIMHVVDSKDDWWRERAMEVMSFNPGETKTLKVVFGYEKGFKPGYAIDPAKIKEIYIYVWDKEQARSLRIKELTGAGIAGEKPAEAPTMPSSRP